MQTITPDTADRKYFILTPNIILALCRDPYDLAVWLVVKLVAGDIGECILSAEDGAALAGMSTGKWVEARQHLISVGALIGEVRRDPGYPQATWHLRIPDLWPANVRWREQTGDSLKSRLADIRERRKSLHHMKGLLGRSEEPSPHEGEPSPGEAFPSPHEGKPSPHETKKNHIEKPKEEPEEACKFADPQRPSNASVEKLSVETLSKASLLDAEVWNRTKTSLRLQLPRATYETWVKDTVLVTADDETCTIRAPDNNARDWLNARLKPKTRNALASIIGHDIDVQFITADTFTAQEVTH